MQHFLKNWHWKSPPKYRNKLRFICEVLPFFNAAASRCQGILSHVLNFQKSFHRLEGRDLMVSHKVLLQCNEILLLIFFKPSQTTKKTHMKHMVYILTNSLLLRCFDENGSLIFQKILILMWQSLHCFPFTISLSHDYFSFIPFHY